MSVDREPLTIVEIDVDGCSLTFGSAPCTAALSVIVKRKCYNTFATCRDVANYTRTTTHRTLRFAEARSNLPKGATIFPVVEGVSEYSATVNIAGSDSDLSALGRRATVKVSLIDFPYHDRLTDPYQAERVSGTAQNDEAGYDPGARGTFFGRLKTRWPHYAGRPLRVVNGYLSGGTFTATTTRHYVITEMTGPDDNGAVTFDAADVLDLAKNDKAVAPKASTGSLSAGITNASSSLALTPTGIGAAEYPASGRALIGSEIVSYTRSGDVVTLTARGVARTAAASHSAGDTFQQVLRFENVRMDDAIRTLLVDYAGIDSAFIPTATWADEIDRWMPDVLLNGHIVKPTGVSTLVGELAVLGVSIWWDAATQLIGLKTSRPPSSDPVYDLTDEANIKEISQEDRDDKRLTQVHFLSVVSDPTKSATSKENFDRLYVTPDLTAESANAYNGQRIREIFCRWLDQGANDLIRVLSQRLLARFVTAPAHFEITLDAKDTAISLTDVLRVNSRIVMDETGKPATRLLQVIERSEPRPGHEIRIVAQAYQFDLRYAVIGPNTLGVYGAESEDNKADYAFIGADTLPAFPDGTDYYRIV
jgi:hypothetical protein